MSRPGRGSGNRGLSRGNLRKVSVHETLYNEIIDATGLSKSEIISRMKKGNVGVSQLQLDQLQEEEKEQGPWSQVSKKSVKKTSAQRQQATGIPGHGGSAQRGRGPMRGDGEDREHTSCNQTRSGLVKQEAAANKKAAKAQAQVQAAANKKAAVAAAAPPPDVVKASTAAAAAAPVAAKTVAVKKQPETAATYNTNTQAARRKPAIAIKAATAKGQKENPSKGVNMGKWAQLADLTANFSFGDFDDDKDGKKNQMINENEKEAAQFILRLSTLDSESRRLNTVKKDGNFLHDESSHEGSADDGTFKGENGKGEGGKKTRKKLKEQNMPTTEDAMEQGAEQVLKSTPVRIINVVPKKNYFLTSANSGEKIHSLVGRQRGVVAGLSWTVRWRLVLCCLCMLFVSGGGDVRLSSSMRGLATSGPAWVEVSGGTVAARDEVGTDTPKDAAVPAVLVPTVPAVTATTSMIEYAGHNNTPIVILDHVLPEKAFLSLEDDLRSRTDFFDGHANDVSFPGKIGIIDRAIVDPLIEAVLESKEVLKHFPKEIFEQREHVRGFASVLCNQGWVHNDYMEKDLKLGHYVVAPAAVFYFGFDRTSLLTTNNKSTTRTGTAFLS